MIAEAQRRAPEAQAEVRSEKKKAKNVDKDG